MASTSERSFIGRHQGGHLPTCLPQGFRFSPPRPEKIPEKSGEKSGAPAKKQVEDRLVRFPVRTGGFPPRRPSSGFCRHLVPYGLGVPACIPPLLRRVPPAAGRRSR